MFENFVKVVVNCYDVVSSSPDCCKSDISESNLVEEFVSIIYFKYFLCGGERLQIIELLFTKFSSTVL